MDGIVVGDAQSIQPAELLAEVRDIEHESRAVSTDRALKLAGMYGAWRDYSHRDGAPVVERVRQRDQCAGQDGGLGQGQRW